MPQAIRAILETDPIYADARLLKAFFEKKTAIGRARQRPESDRCPGDPADQLGTSPSSGVEGKVDEPFGDYVFQWNDGSPSKASRLSSLTKRLGLHSNIIVSGLRYQLVHRTVATLLEAQTIGAREAAMVVQSFSPDSVRAGFGDFQVFGAALGTPIADTGTLSSPIDLDGVQLRLGWAVSSMHSADAV